MTRYGVDTTPINRQNNINTKCHELGRMDQICLLCNAKFWIEERDCKSNLTSPTFAICCAGGKVKLSPLLKPPSYLMNLYTSLDSEADTFHRNLRSYNSLLACTSFGADINEEFQKSGCPILLFMVRFTILLVHCCQMKGKHLNFLFVLHSQ